MTEDDNTYLPLPHGRRPDRWKVEPERGNNSSGDA